MTLGIDNMPKALSDACVPLEKWWLIYTLIAEDILPASVKCVQSNEIYNNDLKAYIKQSAYKKDLFEETMHMKGVQTGILHNNVTLVAMRSRIESIIFL